MTRRKTSTDDHKGTSVAEDGGHHWLRRLGIGSVLVGLLSASMAWGAVHAPAPPTKYVTTTVTFGDVIERVQATGTLQPLLQVNVGAQVNGRVTQVYVDFNSVVTKGEVLAEIDPLIYGTQVSAQMANLAGQRAQLAQAKASMASMTAQMETARAALERTQRLFAANLAAKGDLDTAQGNHDSLHAQLDGAIANIDIQAAFMNAQSAQLNQSRASLGYTKIYAPVDGIVVARGVDPGATVVASFQAPVLFVIAEDLHKMRVLADVDEADVGKLAQGMAADCVVDALPGETFHGVVSQIRYGANNVSGVVTYPAVVAVENRNLKLRPGMTATITVHAHEVHGVPTIPNAALRFKPAPPTGSDGKPILRPPESALDKGRGRVWLLPSDQPGSERLVEHIVTLGITDGVFTAMTDPTLPVGRKIVTDETEIDKSR